jgi:hypothetical protein
VAALVAGGWIDNAGDVATCGEDKARIAANQILCVTTTLTPELLDQLLAGYEKPEDLTGDDGLFRRLKKALIERALGAELTSYRPKLVTSGIGKAAYRGGA